MNRVGKTSILACFKVSKGCNRVHNVNLSLSNKIPKYNRVNRVDKTSILACFKVGIWCNRVHNVNLSDLIKFQSGTE